MLALPSFPLSSVYVEGPESLVGDELIPPVFSS